MVKYFLDTCAILEIIEGNEKYARFTLQESVTSIVNLYECYAQFINKFSKEESQKYYFMLKALLVPFTDKTIFAATEYRKKRMKRDISYVDALGYSIAQERNLLFVTGDGDFEGEKDVLYIPKK